MSTPLFDARLLGEDSSDEGEGERSVDFPADVDWARFSAADFLAHRVDPAWERWKARGNAALQAGQLERARKMYTHAYEIAVGELEGGAVNAFIDALLTWPEGSAQLQLGEHDDALCSIIGMLPTQGDELTVPVPGEALSEGEDGSVTARMPNRPAAIALSNRAAVHLRLGEPKRALQDARAATKRCPEYVKGHFREVQALKALGKHAQARQAERTLQGFNMLLGTRMMAPSHVLLSAGWIGWEDHMLSYEPIRMRMQLRWLRRQLRAAAAYLRELGGMDALHLKANASLVDFQGGQMLVLGADVALRRSVLLAAGPSGPIKSLRVNAHAPSISSMIVECKNEPDQLALPPHGKATPTALAGSVGVIARFLLDMHSARLTPTVLTLGQGLHGQREMLARALPRTMARLRAGQLISQETIKEDMSPDGARSPAPPVDGIRIPALVHTLSTMASEDNGVPVSPDDLSAWRAADLDDRRSMA